MAVAARERFLLLGGGSVTIVSSGSTIVSGAKTLNFTGAGVSVTDAGSGQANIAISGGGGGSYNEVATYADLPVTVGTPAVGTIIVVQGSTGAWYTFNKREKGLYRRTANNGALADWTVLEDTYELTLDSSFALADEGDTTKRLQFDCAGITTATTRVLSVPDANGTIALTLNKLSAFGATTSAELRSVLSDETGTGLSYFQGGDLGTPSAGTLTNCTFPTLNQNTSGSAATLTTTRTIGGSNFNGSANVTSFPSPGAIGGTTPSTGVFTTVNALTITSSTGTLTIAAAKVLTFNNSLTFSGTDSTTMTFPTTSATVARTDAANTFTGVQTITSLTLPTAGQIKLTIPTGDLTATGPTCGDFNSGYSSSAIGDLVYLDSSATWQKTDANTLALYNGLLGIALEVKASASALLVALPGSFIYSTTGFPTWTIGSPIYMSETAGAMTHTAPTTADAATRLVGWGVHADKMYFFPSPDYITHT